MTPDRHTNQRFHRFATRRQFAKGLLVIPAAALGAGLLRPGTGRAASQFAVGDRVVVDTDYLNLRAGAGTDQDVLDVLAYGTEATVTAAPTSASADGYDWVEIQTDGGEAGWVADYYLAAAAGAPGGGGNLFAIGDRLMVNTDFLNLRTGQGTAFDVVDVLPYGTIVMITGIPATGSDDGYDWYQVGVQAGESGWVAGEYLTYPSNSDSDYFGIRQFVQVNTDVLNLRDAPSLDSNVIGSVVYGDTGVVLSDPSPADGYTWYTVDFDGNGSGSWVAGEYLVLASGPAEPTGQEMIVDTDALNLRDGPSLDSDVIDVLAQGARVTIADASFVLADGYTWAQVNYGSEQGWVAKEFLVTGEM
jgi:uncharacterized protein YgiM (DUF1202 family)